jgi:protocatechuate 3,4-dioxygenase beta subunit
MQWRWRVLVVLVASCCVAAEPEKNYPATLTGGAPCGSCNAPEQLSWKTVITSEKEAGEPLIVTGRVFKPDGKTPAEGMVLWVYHTDRTGYYNEKDDASHPRLKGWMLIGANGKYEFRTIRPGAYPHRSTPATSTRTFTDRDILSGRSRITGSKTIHGSMRGS